MKKKVLCILAAGLLVLSSCVNVNLGLNKIEPSENVIEKEIPLHAFSKLDVNVMAHVKFVQSTEKDYRVVMRAPENYMDLYEFKIDGDELKVKFVKSNTNIEGDSVKIMVFAPAISELENSGISALSVDSLKVPALKIDNSGVGAIKVLGLQADRVSVECSGVGGIELEGTAAWVNLDCSGVGGISASRLKARRVQGSVSGVGGIECFATDSLKASVTGVGALKYGGNPQSKILKRTGVGDISEF